MKKAAAIAVIVGSFLYAFGGLSASANVAKTGAAIAAHHQAAIDAALN